MTRRPWYCKRSTNGEEAGPQKKDKFSYARPEDPLLRKSMIRGVERLTGGRFLQRIYHKLKEEGATPVSFWRRALEELNITPVLSEQQLQKIPTEGPLIIIANHPFGLVDGLLLMDIVTRVREDYFLLINEIISHDPLFKGHLLPVDFRETKAAMKTNLRTRRLTSERLSRGETLAIFPGGGVATAFQRGGPVEEYPWRKFICSKIHENNCTVVPIFFHGANSKLFHFVSRINSNLRLGLLLHEVMNKRGKEVQVRIGDPITYPEMAPLRNRQQLIDHLYQRTIALGTLHHN
ncbi:MAG: lysophospholipid acyltransferase family protein [Bacteroidota bacterium]